MATSVRWVAKLNPKQPEILVSLFSASRSPEKTFSPDVGYVRYVRTRFRLSKPHQRRRRKPPKNPLLPLRPIGIPREMTDIHGNLLWYGERTAWGRLKKDERFVNQDPIELWGGIIFIGSGLMRPCGLTFGEWQNDLSKIKSRRPNYRTTKK